MQIVDIADPGIPVEVSRWWRKGQWKAGGETGAPHATLLQFGGAYVRGERATLWRRRRHPQHLRRGAAARRRSALLAALSLFFIAVHTAQPLLKPELVVSDPEAITKCDGPLGFAGIVDIEDETKPRLSALFPLPRPPKGAAYVNFCEKGGRFGPHNQHQWQYQDILFHDEFVCFLASSTPGFAFNMSDERLVEEIAYFVPPDPLERRGVLPKTKLVGRSEDVLVDARGFIYNRQNLAASVEVGGVAGRTAIRRLAVMRSSG